MRALDGCILHRWVGLVNDGKGVFSENGKKKRKKDVVVKEGSLRYGLVESLFLDTSFYFLLLLSF